MSTVSASKTEAQLMEEVAQALVEMRSQARKQARWYSFGALAQFYRGLAILSVVIGMVGFIFRAIGANPAPSSPAASLGIELLFGLLGLVGGGVSLIVSTWAVRYCEAMSDGRIKGK